MNFTVGDKVRIKWQDHCPNLTITDITDNGLLICSWFNYEGNYDQIVVNHEALFKKGDDNIATLFGPSK